MLKTQVMAKRKVHKKSGIDLISLRVGGLRHIVGKLLIRATTLL